MKRRALLTLLVISFCSFLLIQCMGFFSVPKTPQQAAEILVNDRKFGVRATSKAIEFGDKFIPALIKESENFKKLDNRNVFWIAEVLGSIKTKKSHETLTMLYAKKEPLQKLVGAIGLAQQGAYPQPINDDAYLVKIVRSDPNQTQSHLAIIALGMTKHKNALPYLLEILKKRDIGYWYHAYACNAVARIHSKKAVPVLQECLKSEGFHALPNAFRALISLGDKDAITLAIKRISPDIKNYNSGFVVEELEKVTGQNFGFNQQKWANWWNAKKTNWLIPGKYQKPWDEQKDY